MAFRPALKKEGQKEIGETKRLNNERARESYGNGPLKGFLPNILLSEVWKIFTIHVLVFMTWSIVTCRNKAGKYERKCLRIWTLNRLVHKPIRERLDVPRKSQISKIKANILLLTSRKPGSVNRWRKSYILRYDNTSVRLGDKTEKWKHELFVDFESKSHICDSKLMSAQTYEYEHVLCCHVTCRALGVKNQVKFWKYLHILSLKLPVSVPFKN